MLKTTEIDRFEKFASPRQASGAKIAFSFALAIHGIVLTALAAITFYQPKPATAPVELQATLTPAAPQPIDLSQLEFKTAQKPSSSPPVTKLQPVELPNEPASIEIPAQVATLPPASPKSFASNFLPETKRATPAPPQKKKTRAAPPVQRKKTTRRPKPQRFVQASVRSTSRPKYPDSARRKGLQGTTRVRLDLSATGKVTRASISSSSGNSALDAAAVKAAKRWRFGPATSGNIPVASQIVVPISFRLN